MNNMQQSFLNPKSPWFWPNTVKEKKQEKAEVNAISVEGTKGTRIRVTLEQNGDKIGSIRALLDSGACASVMDTGTAIMMELITLSSNFVIKKNSEQSMVSN